MTRRSLATRRGDGSSGLRPDIPGYIDFNGNVGEYVSLSRTALGATLLLDFAVRVKLDALGVVQRLAGWSGGANAGLQITALNQLQIYATGGSGTIGNAASSATVPAQITSQPVWLRGQVLSTTASCSYTYGLTDTNDFTQVVWQPIGTAQIGTNAGTTITMTNSSFVVVGNTFISNAAMTGNVYAFAELTSAIQRSWFADSDIPDPPATTFNAANGGGLWTMAAGMTPNQFVPTQDYQGGLRNDFTFDASSTGILADQLFGVIDVGYTTVRVSYQPAMIPASPTAVPFKEAMVVRSTAGFPATNLDGTVLMRHLSVDPVLNRGFASVLDKDLNPQQWYYYGLFARYDDTTGWYKVAEQAWLNPGEYGNAERIWQGFPDYYQRVDSGGWIYPGVLRRLCDVLGYEFDMHRTWAGTVGDVWDFDKLSAKLLPEAGGALGLPAESANGDRRLRTLVGNLMALRKQKGTRDGVEGYVGALTGYPTRTYEGLNLFLRRQHVEWTNSFTAQDGSADPTTDNHPGWTSKYGVTVYGQLSRQTAASGEGTSVGLPDGSFYLRLTNNTGAGSQMGLAYGHGGYAPHVFIPVIPGHQYKFSTLIKASVSTNFNVQVDWFDGNAVQIGSSVVVALATSVSTTWVRAITALMNAPGSPSNQAKYVKVWVVPSTTMVINATFSIAKPMFVDLAWRPEGIPSLASNVPLSSTNAGDLGTFVHRDYYEEPREVKVNVYPMRTNLALNSDFSLNDQPPGAWSTFDAPTYGQLPIAYTDYADIIDAPPDWEVDYADMASGLYPLTGVPPVLIWDTAGGRLHINRTVAPFGWTLIHTYFPATDLGGMSAAMGAYSSVDGTKMTLAFEWYTSIGTSIKVDGLPLHHSSPEYTLTTTEARYELVNAQPPANALYGRLLVMVSNTVANDTSLTWALIEDAPYPEYYFNGTYNDGEDGDFFFATGKGYVGDASPHQSPSVYYQRFRRFASGVSGADALTTLMPQLLPFRRSFKVVTAATGLYNVPT